MSEFPEKYTPTDEELAARRKRNIALALALAIFVILIFVTMLVRGGSPAP